MFVGAALPGAAWLGEINVGQQVLFEPLVIGEFAAVVERDTVAKVRRILEEAAVDRPRDRFSFQVLDLDQFNPPAAAFDQADQGAALMSRSDDHVAFPIAVAAALIDDRRTIGNVATGVGLGDAASLAGCKATEELLSHSFMIVRLGPGIDRLGGEMPAFILRKLPLQSPGNLFRRPMQLQVLDHELTNFRLPHFAALHTSLSAPPLRPLLGHMRRVVLSQAVAPTLTIERAAGPPNRPRDPGHRPAGLQVHRYKLPFIRAKMSCHH